MKHLKKFNENQEEIHGGEETMHGAHSSGNVCYLVKWDDVHGPGFVEKGTGGFHCYSEDYLESFIDEFFEGSEEFFNKVKNLGNNERLENMDSEQTMNGYIAWIEKIPMN